MINHLDIDRYVKIERTLDLYLHCKIDNVKQKILIYVTTPVIEILDFADFTIIW